MFEKNSDTHYDKNRSKENEMKRFGLWLAYSALCFALLYLLAAYTPVFALMVLGQVYDQATSLVASPKPLSFFIYILFASGIFGVLLLLCMEFKYKYLSMCRFLEYAGDDMVLGVLKRKAGELTDAFQDEEIIRATLARDADPSSGEVPSSKRLANASARARALKAEFWELHATAEDAGIDVFERFKEHADWEPPEDETVGA